MAADSVNPKPYVNRPPLLICREKIKARKFRVDGFYIEAFSCQLHMGPPDSAKPEEDARLQMAAGGPSPPSKSPSPGSASGTTQSASPAEENAVEPAEESRNPGASPSKPADFNTLQDMAVADCNGPGVECIGKSQQPSTVSAVPNQSSVRQGQGNLACSAGHGNGSGQGLSSSGPTSSVQNSLLPTSTQMQKKLCDVRTSGGIPNGFGDCGPQCSPPAIKTEFGGDPAQQAQHANNVFVKSEQVESAAQGDTLEEEAGHHRQGHWQTASQTQHAEHAEHASQSTNMSHPYSTTGYAYPSQTPSHAQRAQRLSAADAEAQLFFMPHSSVPMPTAAMMASNSSGFVAPPSAAFALLKRASSLQQQHLYAQQHPSQRLYSQQQLQQRQWAAQQHYQQQMLRQQQQQQQQQSMGLSREPQLPALRPAQTVRIVHPQKRLPVPSMASAQHAMQASASQPPPSASQNSNGLPSSARDPFGSQHAKHGANGFSNQQQGASGTSPHQKGQHAQHGANGFLHPSVHSMDPQRKRGSGTSTAFIMWCDGQYKARGQLEKRAALRNFVQAAKVGLPSSPSSLSCECSSSMLLYKVGSVSKATQHLPAVCTV